MTGQIFGRGIAACDECTKNCLTIHRLEQRGPSSAVIRFFKIMHGKNCSDVLYLPPKFAQVVRDLVGREAKIEDSNGQTWTVQFSHVDGALAFQKGWHNFVEDHQLEHGELLMFNYIKHGHFVVQIYGLSACEIIDFNSGRKLPKKRSRSDQETAFHNEPHQLSGKQFTTSKNIEDPSCMLNKDSGKYDIEGRDELMDFNRGRKLPKKISRSDQETIFHDEPHQIRNKLFTTSKNMEDPSCMINRDSGKYDLEGRDFLFDLSNFEMGKNSSVAEKSETSLDRNITPVETQISEQIEVIRNDTQMSMPLKDEKNNHLCGISTKAFRTEPSGDINSSKDMLNVSKFQAGEMENNSLHGISSVAHQNKVSGSSDCSKGMPDDASGFHSGEMEDNRLCGIFSAALQKISCGNSDSRKGTPDVIKYQTGGTNNYQSCGIFSDAFLAKPCINNDSGKNMFNDTSKFQACVTSVSPFIASDMKSPYIRSHLLAESDNSFNSKHCDASVTSSMLKKPRGKSAATLKKEVMELREEVDGISRVSSENGGITSTLGIKHDQLLSSIVKTEPDMADDFVPSVATCPFSVKVKSQAFLELPLCMPTIQGRRERGRAKIVYLKSSTTRLWPVMYPGKSFVRVFTNGWKSFCKGNNIRDGDVCRFQLETYMPCVFKVDIVR